MGAIMVTAVFIPFVMLAAMGIPSARPILLKLAPWAALPAFLVAVLFPTGTFMAMPWLFLGGAFALDLTAKVFLAFSAGMWLAAGIYAKGYLEANHDDRKLPFFAFFLGTMGGNLALISAQDMVSYIAFFAIMSFCAYGLIIHERTPANLFAGRVYIAMTILGEVSAFGGMVWAASIAGGHTGFPEVTAALLEQPDRAAILLLLFVGFGIKLGVMPLHVWLPLAHPAAPTPASAVLSGVMIKTGLLLWLRLFPFDEPAVFDGGALVAIGLATAFLAAMIGMTQTHPKALLAYSSISQMGLVAIAIGAGLLMDAGHAAVLGAVLIFAAHHAIAKSALFLGVGIAATDLSTAMRRVLIAGLAMAGAALAGFPLTSGIAAKAGIKAAAGATETGWTPWLDWLVPLTGVTTMLLIVRFLFLIAAPPGEAHGRLNRYMLIPWAVLTLAIPMLPLLILAMGWASPREIGFYPRGVFAAAWPPLMGLAIAFVVFKASAIRSTLAAIRIPAGDVLYPVLRVSDFVRGLLRLVVLTPAQTAQRVPARVNTLSADIRGRVLQRAAKSEAFALGIILMTAIALGMAFIL